MIIRTVKVKNHLRYVLQEIDRGDNKGDIAYYDSLEEAAMVLRYLKGGYMPKEDQQTALRYIFEWDERESMAAAAAAAE